MPNNKLPLNDADDFEEGDDYYDDLGNSSAGGLYDAGGHPISERWADYADAISDRLKYGE